MFVERFGIKKRRTKDCGDGTDEIGFRGAVVSISRQIRTDDPTATILRTSDRYNQQTFQPRKFLAEMCLM